MNIKDFGKIMQDVYDIAKKSDEHTWFVELDDFEDGTYTQEDLDRLNQDIETLKELGVEDVYCIIESSDKITDDLNYVAAFYGAFLELFDEKGDFICHTEQ